MSDDPPTTQPDRLDAAIGAVLDLRPALEAGAPWPLAERYGTEPEASWGPPEILAHLDEMLPYWLGEAERILDGVPGGGPVPFGRIADDPIRIGVIGRDRTVPMRELLARLEADGARVATRLRVLTPADWSAIGRHPRGDYSLTELFERFVVGHTEDHRRQLRESVDRVGSDRATIA